MIVRATAIPLAWYPFSSTSRVVHWLTRHHGKVSTLLKGALRPKSPFLGEYELFGTSELLYFAKRTGTLHTGKECALLHRREAFRTNWRAMQSASYISALFHKTTPEEAPQPELFGFYEELLDLAEQFGYHPHFLLWAELKFCGFHGHAPNLGNCVLCASEKELRFSASQGGTVCRNCAKTKQIPTLECPPEALATMQAWQKSDRPDQAIHARLDGKQHTAINAISGTFMAYQFSIQPEHRIAALQAA